MKDDFEFGKPKELTPQMIGTIVSGVKRGSSYAIMSKSFGISRGRVRRICQSHGVASKFYFSGDHTTPIETKKNDTAMSILVLVIIAILLIIALKIILTGRFI